MPHTRTQIAGLTTHILGPADATTTCLLLHGFGASGEDLVGLAAELAAPVRFVLPEGLLELGGMYGNARAWWMIDLALIERGPWDGRHSIPDGLPAARAAVTALVDELTRTAPAAMQNLVLGGFSQGAMLALDVALHRPAPPAGVLFLSGTPIAAAQWTPRLPSLSGVPIVVSHGRYDPLLAFPLAEALRDELIAAGAVVDWQPFDGGHEIPMDVVDAADALLAATARRA